MHVIVVEMSGLSAEQRSRIEENRRKALLRRAQRSKGLIDSNASTGGKATQYAMCCPSNSANAGTSSTSTTSVMGAKGSPCPKDKNSFYSSTKPAIRGCFRLISSDRFVVDIGYNQDIIAKFRLVPGHMYHPNEKQWSFHLSNHDQLVESLKELKPAVVVAPLPGYVLKCLRQPAPPTDHIDLSGLDPALLEALMPFQRDGIRMGVARRGRVLLADDMGLGKTIQAIGIVSYFHDWPLLVVCPSSMRYQWRQEFLRFLPSQHPSTVVVMDSSKDFDADARVLIVSYDLLSRCADRLRSAGFLSVIMDESHCLKNAKAARTRAAQPLMRAARRCLLLSGTPALSRPAELYTQICAVDRALVPSFTEFGLRYCAGKRTAWGWDFSGASHMTELQAVLERRVMIRRLKRDVIGQLPAKRRQLVLLDPAQVSARTSEMSRMERRMGQCTLRGMERRGALLEYFRETGAAKLPAVSSYLDDLLESDCKFICFAHHQLVLDGVCQLLARRREAFIRIDGATSAQERKRECDRFQSGDRVRAAVLSITAASTGVTLTAASLVVFAELFWNPGVLTQAEDRAHRIGQQDSVQVRYLVAKGTADDHIWPLVQSKLNILNKAGLSKDDFSEADQDRQQRRSDQTAITDFFSEFEDVPLEDLLAEPAEDAAGTADGEVGSAEGDAGTVEGEEGAADNTDEDCPAPKRLKTTCE